MWTGAYSISQFRREERNWVKLKHILGSRPFLPNAGVKREIYGNLSKYTSTRYCHHTN